MSANDQIYLHDNGDRAEVLVDEGAVHVVTAPFRGPASRVTHGAYVDPKQLARTLIRQGYSRIRQEPMTRVLSDIAPDVMDRVQRFTAQNAEDRSAPWVKALEAKAFCAQLTGTLGRRQAWALLRYVRMRHARVLVLDARTSAAALSSGAAGPHRQPLVAWLEALTQSREAIDTLVFRDCRFHRDDQAHLSGAAPHAHGVAFVGGLPKDVSAFKEVETLTLGCRRPKGVVPAAAIGALSSAGVDPVELRLELGRAQLADQAAEARLVRWFESAPSPGRRMRRVFLAGAKLSLVSRLLETPVGQALDVVHWEGRLAAGELGQLASPAASIRVVLRPLPGSEREGLGRLPDGVEIAGSGTPPVCPY